jgi:hypothetical protein
MRAWFRSGPSLFMAVIGVAALLFVGAAAYWHYATYVPTVTLPPTPMPEPNGYDRYEKAVARLSVPVPPRPPRDWPSGSPKELRAYLLPRRPLLNEVRAALKLQWRMPPRSPLSSGSPPFPLFASTRESARCFVAESRLAASQGDRSAAMQRSLDAMELGSKVPWGAALIGRLVGLAIHAIGLSQVERLVPLLPAEAIPTALTRVRQVRESWPPLSDTWESERQMTVALLTDSFQQMRRQSLRQQYDALQSAQSDASPWGTLRLAVTPRRLPILNADRCLRQLIAESKKPFRQRRAIPPPDDAWSQAWGGLVTYGPELELRLEIPQTHLALIETALAVRMHRLALGRYPARLAEVDRRWLPAIPRDLWGQPIAYRLRNGQPVTYSLGPDGNDDGGRAIDPLRLTPSAQGDLVFGKLTARRRR